MRLRTPALLLAAALAGCGGGGASQSTAIPQAAAPAANGAAASTYNGPSGTVTTTITIPNTDQSQSGHRNAQYVSASTKSMKVVITPTTASAFTAITAVYNLIAGSNGCTGTGATLVCNLSIPAPAVSETFTFVVYDTAATGSGATAAIPTTAKALSWGIKSAVTPAAGTVSTLSITMTAVANNYFSSTATAVADAQTGSVPMESFALASGSYSLVSPGALKIAGPTSSSLAGLVKIGTSGQLPVYDAGGNIVTALTTVGSTNLISAGIPTTLTNAATAPNATVVVTETAATACATTTGATKVGIFAVTNTAALAVTNSASTLLTNAGDGIQVQYTPGPGPGYFSVIDVNGLTQDYTYTLATLGFTSTATSTATTGANYSCANQALTFLSPNATAAMTVVEHGIAAATGFTMTVPSVCANIATFTPTGGTAIAADGSAHTLTALTFSAAEVSNPTLEGSPGGASTLCVPGVTDKNGVTSYFSVGVPSGGSLSL